MTRFLFLFLMFNRMCFVYSHISLGNQHMLTVFLSLYTCVYVCVLFPVSRQCLLSISKERCETFENELRTEAKNNECSSSSVRWSRRKDEMYFEQAYTHVRQFVKKKNGLHKIVFSSSSFILSYIYIYIYVHMYILCFSFTLTSRPQNVN